MSRNFARQIALRISGLIAAYFLSTKLLAASETIRIKVEKKRDTDQQLCSVAKITKTHGGSVYMDHPTFCIHNKTPNEELDYEADDEQPGLSTDHEEDCQWKGKLSEFKKHLQECGYEYVECKYFFFGCKEEVRRKNLEQHMRDHTDAHLELVQEYHRKQKGVHAVQMKKLKATHYLLVQEAVKKTENEYRQKFKALVRQVQASQRAMKFGK